MRSTSKSFMGIMLIVAGALPLSAQRESERPRWEYGQFEWLRDLATAPPGEVARWTVGDSIIVSLKSIDDLYELVTRRRPPKVTTQHTLFAWLGDQRWEMVSCEQVDPTEAVRRQTLTCWFKRQKP